MDRLEYVEGVKEIAERLNCYVKKDTIKKLSKYYLLAEDSERDEIKEDIDDLLGFHLPRLVFSEKPMLPSPEREEIDGEIKIGRVTQGAKELYDFGLLRKELNQHMLITARSGAGKTTLIIQIIRQLISASIPFLVFDYKRDYRHLIRHCPELVVVSWRDLRINPLEPPPGVSFREWKQQFLNIFGHVEAIWHGSTQYLLGAMDKAYEEKRRVPTLEEVYRKVVEANETARKMREYASVVETRLYGLISKLGETINSEKTLIDMEKLLQLPVVLELDGLGRDEADILALWLFYWIYAYRRAKSMRGKLLHVLIIDEAKRIFTGSEQYSQTTAEYSGIPPADLVCDEIRDFGEAIVAADQEPTKLSNSLKANTYTKITGYLGNGRDIDDIAEAMNLSDEEREAISKLEVGEWLIKLAGRYVKPFTIKSEDFPLEKNVSDEEVKARMKPLIERLYRKFGEGSRDEKPEAKLSEDAWKLLENINSHPFSGISGRQRELGFSARRIERAKDELMMNGLIKRVEIPLTSRRPTSFLVLTSKALQILEAKGFDTGLWKHVGNVGFEHMLYQVLIRWQFKKLGYNAHVEVSLNGRRIDVLAVKDGRKVGVEVELNAKISLREKLKVANELDELYIVTSKKLFHEIRERLELPQSRVRLYSIDKFLERLRNLPVEKTGKNPPERNKSGKSSSPRNNSRSSSFHKSRLRGRGDG